MAETHGLERRIRWGKNFHMSEYLATYSIPEPNSGCTLWIGAATTRGYGMFQAPGQGKGPGRKHTMAHRASFELAYGPIPPGLHCLHKCDNPPCINPQHLSAGTVSDNMQDCSKKGRINKKFTRDQVVEIRSSPLSFTELAPLYGMSKSYCWAIKAGKKRKEV